jgi:hypothetical protein
MQREQTSREKLGRWLWLRLCAKSLGRSWIYVSWSRTSYCKFYPRREAGLTKHRGSYTEQDLAIRFAYLKLAEVVAASVPEPIPGTVIKLQTPVETPITTPKIRLSMSAMTPSVKPETEGGFRNRQMVCAEPIGYGFPAVLDLPQQQTPPPLTLVLNGSNSATKKKSKPVIKATQGGMSEAEYKTIKMALERMVSTVADRC